MNTTAWKWAGMALAIVGSITMAEAGQGKGDGKGGEKSGRKGERPSREEMMQKYDKDGDGQLSGSELEQLKADRIARRGDPKGERGGERPSKEEMLKRFDADGDGQLSEEERPAMRKTSKKRKREQQNDS